MRDEKVRSWYGCVKTIFREVFVHVSERKSVSKASVCCGKAERMHTHDALVVVHKERDVFRDDGTVRERTQLQF